MKPTEATSDRKARTRARLLDAAGRGFRRHGFDGVGVDGIAKAAGATSGAFYAHLGSKAGAFAAALELGLSEVLVALPEFRAGHGAAWPEAFVDYYLGDTHRANADCICAMTALSPDVARGDGAAHAIYEAKMTEIVAVIADGLTGDAREDRAWAFLAALIGGLTALRAMDGPAGRARMAPALRAAARAAAGPGRAPD